MIKRWRLLLIEDQDDDAALVLAELRRAGFDFNWKRIYVREEIQNALQNEKWDLIISDYALPGFNGLAALNLCQKLGVETPFIIVSGTIGEDTAVDMLKSGAADYLLKGNLAHLSASVQKALRDAAIRQEQKRAEKLERVLFHISQAANMASELKEFFATIHESLKQVMHAENFYIALYDSKRNIISFPYFVDQFDPIPLPKHPGRGMTEYVLRTGKPSLVTPEVFSGLEAAGEVETSGSPSLDWVGVPLKAGDLTLGVMVVQTYDEGIRYEKRDVDVLDFISDQVEMVIHRKLAEESLRESEHKFSLFMDHLPLQSTISDDNGRLIYANNETLRMLGDRNAIGKTYTDIFPPELAKMLQDYDLKAMQDGLVHQMVIMETSQGRKNLEMIKFRISNPDDAMLVGGIVLDITERMQAEEKIRMAAEELASAYDETLEGWSRALEIREKETAGHSKRVVALTLQLARAVGVPEDQLIHIRRGSFLHDIGKMGIPDSILLKPGPLSAEEWIIMRQHPTYAYKLLKPIKFLSQALEIPYCHHERWNGTGYPRGLKGEQIPLSGRIFAVVDIWDALNSERSYRPAWPESAVRDFLIKESGRLLDACIVEKFFEILDDTNQPNV